MSETEWATCNDPLQMLDAVRGSARSEDLRRFAVVCCEPLLAVLDELGRRAVEVADRLARGEASEAERALAECAAFRLDDYNEDGERYCYNDDYVAAGDPPYRTDPRFAATEAAVGAVSADAWVAARVAARSALEAAGGVGRAAEQARLCRALRSILSTRDVTG